jgi:F-type H+-transporting ATPase subunit b
MLKVDWNLLFNMINVFVLYLLMKKFLFGPVSAMMEKRANAVKESFAEAENAKTKAHELKQNYEQELAKAEIKAEAIVKEAKQKALEEYEKQIEAAKEEASKIMEESKKRIELERTHSMQDIESEVAKIALLAASKVIQKNISDSTNEQIINDFLAEAGAGK